MTDGRRLLRGSKRRADAPPGAGRGFACALTAIVLVGALPRLLAIFDDFWLDEIFSWFWARKLASPVEILTRFHEDNNHHLNTLFLYLLGERENWAVYRLLSLATGIAAVPLAALIAWKRGPVAALTTAILLASSYPLIVYSSEARGYAPAIFFALLSFFLLRERLEGRGRFAEYGFWISAVLGLLSHLSFAHFYFACLIWSGWKLLRERPARSDAAVAMVNAHLVPLSYLAVLYVLHIRVMSVGGGPQTGPLEIIAQVSALALGVVERGPAAAAAAVVAIFTALIGLRMLWREGSDLWLLYLCAIFAVPASLLLVRPPEVLFPRYFLVSTVFFLLLLGHLLSQCARRGPLGVLVCGLALLVLCLGNGWQTARFIRHTRGHYLDALTFLAEETPGEVISVGTDHPFRNPVVLAFYRRYLPEGKEIAYFAHGNWPDSGTEWYIVHDQSPDAQGEASLVVHGRIYDLAAAFDYYGLSGWHWFVYRRRPE